MNIIRIIDKKDRLYKIYLNIIVIEITFDLIELVLNINFKNLI